MSIRQKFGFEVEFAAEAHFYSALNASMPLGFSVGTDITAQVDHLKGFEMRTGIFKQGLPRNKFRQALDVIKRFNGRVHKYCGVHIHFSGLGPINEIAMREHIMKNKLFWNSRRKWCGNSHGRYTPFRHIEGDHYEIRCFNGTLNFRAICNYYRLTRKLIRQFPA